MKKSVFLLALFAFTAVASAGQIIWSASGLTSTFEGGTAYLVQMTSGTHTIKDISGYLSSAGIDYSGNDFKYWKTSSHTVGDGTIVENQGYYYAASVTAQETISPSTDLSNFFVVVINGEDYAVSDFVSGTPIAGDAANWNPAFPGSWTTGTLGLVPEPTALALLVLGVAGVALRRRVA